MDRRHEPAASTSFFWHQLVKVVRMNRASEQSVVERNHWRNSSEGGG
jgi:hypothetical protein